MFVDAESIEWRVAPMPKAALPLKNGRDLRLGKPWKWTVKQGSASQAPLFLAFDSSKEEYRLWQTAETETGSALVVRVEHHGHHPGWHAHPSRDKGSALTAKRRDISGDDFPLLSDPRLWNEPVIDRLRALFPFETIEQPTLSAIARHLHPLSNDVTIRTVPFGAAIGLPTQGAHGDTLGFYIAQLGQEDPIFRLEDDGTTIPLLQACGCLDASRSFDFSTFLDTVSRQDFHFSPDNRTLFTPFFPFDELYDRAAAFAAVLDALWSRLSAASTDAESRGRMLDSLVTAPM